jgi:hypothetical protein
MGVRSGKSRVIKNVILFKRRSSLSSMVWALWSIQIQNQFRYYEHSYTSLGLLGRGMGPWNVSTYTGQHTLTYLLIYLLSPWCTTLFEKLIVTQLVKKYLAFLWNPKVHYRVHKSPPLDPILRKPDPVRPIDPYLPNVHLNVILPPTPRSS